MISELILLLVLLVVLIGVIIPTYAYGGDPFFFLRKKVYLLDHNGNVRVTRQYIKNGEFYAPVYAFTGAGDVILYPNGCTGGKSSYIKFWSYNKETLFCPQHY